jgi:hypothetical protein
MGIRTQRAQDSEQWGRSRHLIEGEMRCEERAPFLLRTSRAKSRRVLPHVFVAPLEV